MTSVLHLKVSITEAETQIEMIECTRVPELNINIPVYYGKEARAGIFRFKVLHTERKISYYREQETVWSFESPGAITLHTRKNKDKIRIAKTTNHKFRWNMLFLREHLTEVCKRKGIKLTFEIESVFDMESYVIKKDRFTDTFQAKPISISGKEENGWFEATTQQKAFFKDEYMHFETFAEEEFKKLNSYCNASYKSYCFMQDYFTDDRYKYLSYVDADIHIINTHPNYFTLAINMKDSFGLNGKLALAISLFTNTNHANIVKAPAYIRHSVTSSSVREVLRKFRHKLLTGYVEGSELEYVNLNVIWEGKKMDITQALSTTDNVLFMTQNKTIKGSPDFLTYTVRHTKNSSFDITYEDTLYVVRLNKVKEGVEGNTLYLKYNKHGLYTGRIEDIGIFSMADKSSNFVTRLKEGMANSLPILTRFSYNSVSSLELKKARRTKVSDYTFNAGIEFETGITNLNANYRSAGPHAKDVCFYSYGYDAGGIELRSTVMEDPTLFNVMGRYDHFCKTVRQSSQYYPNFDIGTHIHMSINPTKPYAGKKGKGWVSETGMLRKKLIQNNWFSLLNKYTVGLSFFDAFNPSGRRRSYYGLPIEVKKSTRDNKKYTYFKDARFSDNYFGIRNRSDTYNYLDRNALLRTHCGGRNGTEIHWEWRGTDGCFSAVFMGLKIELLKAIAKHAVDVALEGKELPFWDITVKEELFSIHKNIESVAQVTDVFCREKGKLMLKELKSYMPTYAYKGLAAWAEYVDILDEETGRDGWYKKYEEIIIKKIGVSNFLTKESVDKLFVATNKQIELKAKGTLSAKDKKKAKLYKQVVGKAANSCDIREYDGGYHDATWQNYDTCMVCSNGRVTKKESGFCLCKSCYEEETKSGWDTINISIYKDKRNAKKAVEEARKIVEELFT